MNFTIESEREEDGRWLAEVPELPGVLAYSATAAEAMAKAEVLALRVLAERLENNKALSPSRSQSRLRDFMAFVEDPPCSRRTFPNWAGRSSASPDRTGFSRAQIGRILSSSFTAATLSAPNACPHREADGTEARGPVSAPASCCLEQHRVVSPFLAPL